MNKDLADFLRFLAELNRNKARLLKMEQDLLEESAKKYDEQREKILKKEVET